MPIMGKVIALTDNECDLLMTNGLVTVSILASF